MSLPQSRIDDRIIEMKLIFKKSDLKKELWFINNAYAQAKKAMGPTLFKRVIDTNIPGIYSENEQVLKIRLSEYLKEEYRKISKDLEKERKNYENRFKKISALFFKGCESTCELKWKNKTYVVYLMYSCFWGGDYDENGNTVYINPFLKLGDPSYVIFHELSHLLFWEYIHDTRTKAFIKKWRNKLWELSEIMVNYPLQKIPLTSKFPTVVPPRIKASLVLNKFGKLKYKEIIDLEIKKLN